MHLEGSRWCSKHLSPGYLRGRPGWSPGFQLVPAMAVAVPKVPEKVLYSLRSIWTVSLRTKASPGDATWQSLQLAKRSPRPFCMKKLVADQVRQLGGRNSRSKEFESYLPPVPTVIWWPWRHVSVNTDSAFAENKNSRVRLSLHFSLLSTKESSALTPL